MMRTKQFLKGSIIRLFTNHCTQPFLMIISELGTILMRKPQCLTVGLWSRDRRV